MVLPTGAFAETSGTFVNAEGRWQSWTGAAKLPGESRPGWKVLRVLANLLNVHGVDYASSEEIREALKALCGDRIEPTSNGVDAGGRGAAAPAAEGARRARGWIFRRTRAMRWCAAPRLCRKTKDGRMARTVI